MPHGPGGGPIPVTPSGAIPHWGFPALEAGREDRRVSTLFVIPIDAPGLRYLKDGKPRKAAEFHLYRTPLG